METNEVEIKKIENTIKQIEKTLKKDKEDFKFAEKAVNQEAAKLLNNKPIPYPRPVVENVINQGKIAYSIYTPVEEKDSANEILTSNQLTYGDTFKLLLQYLEDYVHAQDSIKADETDLAKYKADLENLKKKPAEEKKVTESDIPDGKGHLYPVALVVSATQKLDHWNSVLDGYIKKLEETQFNWNITWLLKKIEWVCRKINYALAIVRYEIIKGLSPIFKKVQESMGPLASVGAASVTDPVSAVTFCKSVIDFYVKPYKVLIQFIQDFMKYTPPLVSSSASLVAKAAIIPPLALSRINLVAEDKDGKQKELAEVYKQYIDIHMDPITMGDLMGGEPKKPAMAEFSPNKEQYQLLDKQLDVAENNLLSIWEDMKKEMKETYNDNMEDIVVKYPCKISMLEKDAFQNYYIDGRYETTFDQDLTAVTVYEIADALEKAKRKKEKAIEKAKKAQEATAKQNKAIIKKQKAEQKAQQNANNQILNEELQQKVQEAHAELEKATADAEKAKLEAQKALEEAENMSTAVDIPWGDKFNTVRYPTYAMVSTKELVEKLNDGYTLFSDLYSNIQSYYEDLFIDNEKVKETRTMKKTADYVAFLEKYKPLFPCIKVFFDKLKDLVIEKSNISKQMSSLNKRSIFK